MNTRTAVAYGLLAAAGLILAVFLTIGLGKAATDLAETPIPDPAPTVYVDQQYGCEYLIMGGEGFSAPTMTPRLDQAGEPVCGQPREPGEGPGEVP